MKDATDLVLWFQESGADIDLIDMTERSVRHLEGIGSVSTDENLEGIRVGRKKITIDPGPWARRFLRSESEKGIRWLCITKRSGRKGTGVFVYYVEPWVSVEEVDAEVSRGVWMLDREGELDRRVRRELEKLDPSLVRNAQVNEVISALENEAFDRKAVKALGYGESSGSDPEWIVTGREWLNLENGMFNWRTGAMREWSWEDWSKVRIPCNWLLTEEETREWLELVEDVNEESVDEESVDEGSVDESVWRRSQEWVEGKLRSEGFGEWLEKLEMWIPDEESRWFLQEYFGYCLIPEAASRTVVFLYGVGGNGKSRVTEALKSLVGVENCLEQPLEAIVEGRFARVGLDGKDISCQGNCWWR